MSVTANPGVGGAAFDSETIGGFEVPGAKSVWGADGVKNRTDIANGKPFPVQLRDATGALLTKAEDAAHVSGDFGIMALTVRANTAAATSGADGDYQPLVTDTNGRLHVIEPSQAAQLTALQLIDDTVFAEDVAAQAGDKGMSVLAVRRDANTSLVGADNDYANLQVTALGALKVAITEDTVGSATDTEDGTIAGGQANVALTGSLTMMYDGSNWKRVSTTTPLPIALRDGAGNAITSTTGAIDVNIAGDSLLSATGLSASATFTPAASSHVANDCNGAAGTFALAAVSAGLVMITDVALMISGATAEATAWRLYLYNVTPPSATADDGAWDLPSGDRASFLGFIDIGTAVDMGSTQWVKVSGLNTVVKLAGQSVFGYLVNTTTLTPAAIAHIVTVFAVQL